MQVCQACRYLALLQWVLDAARVIPKCSLERAHLGTCFGCYDSRAKPAFAVTLKALPAYLRLCTHCQNHERIVSSAVLRASFPPLLLVHSTSDPLPQCTLSDRNRPGSCTASAFRCRCRSSAAASAAATSTARSSCCSVGCNHVDSSQTRGA